MSHSQSSAPAKHVSTLSGLHNQRSASSEASKSDVLSSPAKSAGAGATASSDLSLHGADKKQQLLQGDFADAVNARFAILSQQQTASDAKVDSLLAMVQQLSLGMQQLGMNIPTAKATPVESKATWSASAQLQAAQEARLAAVKETAFVTNAKVLGASKQEKEVLTSVLDGKVSSALGSLAGSAGLSAAMEQATLDHHLDLLRRERDLQVKMTTLGQAKSFPDLVERLNKLLVANAADKHYVAFHNNHTSMLASLNDARCWNAAKQYHHDIFDKLNVLTTDEDKKAFYLTNVNGNAWVLNQVVEKFQLRRDKNKEGGNNNNNNFRGGRGKGNHDGSFRGGRGRGAGRGWTETSASASTDKKPGVV